MLALFADPNVRPTTLATVHVPESVDPMYVSSPVAGLGPAQIQRMSVCETSCICVNVYTKELWESPPVWI